MRTSRAAVATADNQADEAEEADRDDEDHGGHGLEAEGHRVLVCQGGHLLGRSCVVSQLVHLVHPHDVPQPSRPRLSVS